MDFAAIANRAKAVSLDPGNTWPQIAAEGGDRQALFMGYALPLLLIGPICGFLGLSLFGPVPIFAGIRITLMQIVLGVAALFLSAWIAAWLAPRFAGTGDQMQGFKLMAYAATPAWLAGVFNLLPYLGWIAALVGAVWSLYLLYTGVVPLMRVPAERAVVYVVALIAVVIAIFVVISLVLFPLLTH